MNIFDHTITDINKVVIDFGCISQDEYDSICAVGFGLQGKALSINYSYEEVDQWPKWMFWKKNKRVYVRERVGAAFEFPNKGFIDQLLAELPRYVGE